ncbi:ABC transporter related protein [Thermobaculum terrenum ATCC BAA-798]|uniref:ABC transporter related protein n=1 Tax=Thermobaculum terrenum (strain ATCC BAA-798 / CCMEE 7001 / YNP1) TaxID=525904 RepID=D1CBA9_THET1|nr:ABC transporter ATP-binding protein [Thermobaculum terrenum]ACZ42074.1 ABC transporter related protein [Thermobaculum terrenum ATCC BAA-798]
MNYISKLARLIYPYKRFFIISIISTIAANVASLFGPYIIRLSIDYVQSSRSLRMIGVYALLLLLAAAVEGYFRFSTRYFGGRVAREIEYELRNKLFRHLQFQDRQFFQSWHTGDLMARATNDLNAIQRSVSPGITNLFNTLAAFVSVVSVMLSISVVLTLYSVFILPLMSIIFIVSSRVIERRFEYVQSSFGDMSTKVQENASGVRVIKAYAQEDNEIKDFERINKQYLDASVSFIKIQSLLWPSMYVVAGIATVILLFIGGRQVIQGRMSIGELTQFLLYIGSLRWPMISIGWVVNLIQQGAASMNRIEQIISKLPSIRDEEPGLREISSIEGEIEFRNVSLTIGSHKILKNINLKVPAGSTLGIIGPTGSGKSMLVSLVPRLWDPTEGQILIDGINIRQIPLKVLRKNIGFVTQDTFLFSDTLKENITFGTNNKDESLVRWAAEVSQLSKDVEQFPKGYETIVGERGVTLSGGQKQRTTIARAIARDPKILILDDALSSVDTNTESEILKRLKTVMQQRTSIIVAHRISAIQNADQIIVLSDGEIVEQGKHSELLELDGLYASIYRRQLIAEELGVDEADSSVENT